MKKSLQGFRFLCVTCVTFRDKNEIRISKATSTGLRKKKIGGAGFFINLAKTIICTSMFK